MDLKVGERTLAEYARPISLSIYSGHGHARFSHDRPGWLRAYQGTNNGSEETRESTQPVSGFWVRICVEMVVALDFI